ncbi:MAG: pyruvate dehydrogenase complex dihydrolipoamide acetyltransferase [Pseudomonadota bacterium]
MPTSILMPALSPTMEEGTLAKWNVKVGDKVSSGDVIAEIETDKATMEVEAVDDGVIGKILVEEGAEGVKVNAEIAVLIEDGESADAPAADEKAPSVDKSAATTPGAAPPTDDNVYAKTNGADTHQPSTSLAAPSRETLKSPDGERLRASPLARRIAQIEGINLTAVRGSGPHGRVVKRDVEAAKATISSASAPQAVSQHAKASKAFDPRLYPAETYESVKLDGMRKVIAARLNQSFNDEVPHFPLMVDVDLDALLAARKRINAQSPTGDDAASNAYKLSVNDFIIKACAQALMAVPEANASFTEDALIRHKHADIGVAVAIDGGLITPIVWRAEDKGLKQISAEIKDLAARARNRKLKPEEYQGGTFAVSNLGMFGIKAFASIINQPHGAILSVGAGEERAVVRDGQITIATQMTVTLTCDHRVVDGAVGAAFLSVFKSYIEEPTLMLL